MATKLYFSPFIPAFSNIGVPIAQAKLYFYYTATATLAPIYADADATVPLTNPVQANLAGKYPDIFLDAAITYRVVQKDALDVQIGDAVDPYIPGTVVANVDSTIRNDLFASSGAGLVSATQTGTGAVTETLLAAYRRGQVFPQQFSATALGTGSDDSAAIQKAINAAAGRVVVLPYVAGGYKINTPLTITSATTIVGQGGVLLYTTINGQHILSGDGLDTVTIQGVRFQGSSSNTLPTANPTGYGAAVTALVSISNSTDVRITDCEFSTFYNGLTTINCTRVWVERNRIRNFFLYGALGSLCQNYIVAENVITDCTQTGGAVAYGIMATGDEIGGKPLLSFIVTGNYIKGVRSWGAIMSHDGREIVISNNVIDDCRTGVDIGHFTATNLLRRVVISGNTINGTTTDTWAGASANSGGILVLGYDNSIVIDAVTIADNVISNFFTATGMAGTAGISSNITVGYVTNITVSGNTVSGAGSITSNAGINVLGRADRACIVSNTLRGSMGLGGIRFTNVIADALTLGGNNILQTTPSVEGVLFTGTTITRLAATANATNSTSPFSVVTSTIGYSNSVPQGTFTGSLTGCTTSPTGTLKYSINGDLVTLEVPTLTATSNATTCTITGVPAEISPNNDQTVFGITTDNGVDGVAKIQIQASGVIALSKGATLGGFAASGTKGIGSSTFTYRRSS